ncbi:RICIN domain-containing protein [Streptomyces sp. 3213.3]|uniref:RICIN domain-containing protein n=1 Tax=Streptomyces sp. 3213.3 TaxID=1855348 RepID=UPI000A8A5434|nr:RICIN domain-containing protein [Streptomyces sp. 3213.3]
MTTGWSPTGSDTSAWWQVDLGSAYALGQFSFTTRQDVDQPETRSNFEIRGSNDPTFADYTVLRQQDATVLPYSATLTAKIDVRQKFRNVRVAKTDGGYFYIDDFSVQQAGGALENPPAAPSFNASTYYTIKNVNSGKTLGIANASHAKGAALVQMTYSGGNNQLWHFEPASSGYVIRNFESRQALEVPGDSTTGGTALGQWTLLNQTNQLWTIQ